MIKKYKYYYKKNMKIKFVKKVKQKIYLLFKMTEQINADIIENVILVKPKRKE